MDSKSKNINVKNVNKVKVIDIIPELAVLPKKPGVYLFKDSSGKIIYVGKAKNLSDRVKTYFQHKDKLDYITHPISFFTNKIASFDYIVTENDVEALILESNLIKKNRPKYNIYLKDDKSYPFVVLTENESYPRIFITRNKNIKGAKYFGPFTNVKNLKELLVLLRKIFKIRDCNKPTPGKIKNSVCLNYHIELCSAPCVGNISEFDYRQNTELIKLLFTGKGNKIIKILKNKMAEYSAHQEYEKADSVKKQIELIDSLMIDQKIFFNLTSKNSWDAVSCSFDEELKFAAVSVFSYRNNELVSVNNFLISNVVVANPSELLSAFIKDYYLEIDNISSFIHIPYRIEDKNAIEQWFKQLKGKKIEIKVPKKGPKKEVLEMATKNAVLFLEKKKFEKSSGHSKVFKELLNIKELLGLKNIPKRIECYDISNIGPNFCVGAMSVLINGSPLKSNYRHFKIKTVAGQDDFSMISEILSRRIKYLANLNLNIEESFYEKPDLIVIDGGKAQYNAAKRVLDNENIHDIDLISIAKKHEIIYCSKYPDGFLTKKFEEKHQSIARIIYKARDEAHRFAITFHRKLREKHMTNSILDGIKGIGKIKKEKILSKYPTLDELKSATLQDLLKIKGLSYKDAVNIYDSLNRY